MQRTFVPAALRERLRTLARGDRLNPLDLIEWLEEQGYEPEIQVSKKGELALRGGIVDVFPPTSPWPVRLEFFGDELESLRQFDPATQLSREAIERVTLPPSGELGLLKQMRQAAGGRQGGELETRNPKLETPNGAALGTLLDYLPRETVFLLCEPALLDEHAAKYAAQVPPGDPFFVGWETFQDDMAATGMTTVRMQEAETSEAVSQSRRSRREEALFRGQRSEIGDQPKETEPPHVGCDGLGIGPELSASPPATTSELHFTSLEAFRPLAQRAPDLAVAEAQRREFFGQLHRWLRQGFAVHVFCNNDGERQRFGEIWEEYGLSAESPKPKVQSLKSAERAPHWTLDIGHWTHLGTLSRGFLFEEAKLVVVTDAEIFGRYRIQRPRRLKSPHALAVRSALDIDFTELEEGDYVVHLQHGIGRYQGLQPMPGIARWKRESGADSGPLPQDDGEECLVIEYAPREPDQPAPKLYVPVTESHLVSKYVGAGKARPPLNVLGGARWAKTKQQAERAVRDLAGEMLAIQAARETQAGHAFQADAPWQREFEGAFIYEETPDQWRAIADTKADMERPKPMDRLICGDVGFGKTEVAIRAAFKAVLDGRQVAVLVPTTVLAQQHFNTFRERMADYPVKIELLSRFRTRRAQQAVVRGLAAGSVDIVVGTHRLVQRDIVFKDLGLVVIDEEQRFGVQHKEKFKQLRRLVDVLTLSATPIPRTLYLALVGARDMSTIQTPPHDRLPVETIVAEYDERVIRDAIIHELNRGGQVFFLHNRVLTIDLMADKLRALVPDARLVVGHGQMHADELEEVMTKFVNGEADVLLSTTIIESGLDIPNANTIIIDRADRFGLSDLYQLRGRVGRYKHQAYAYLLIPRHARLLTDARKRISALRQYSSLGSGFKIAMRDLEIRGAGNLLGAAQSGHITAVGFELYCQLLKQSVAALKGERVKPRIEVQLRLDFLAMNPAEESSKFKVQSSKLGARADPLAELDIVVPRETWSYADEEPPDAGEEDSAFRTPHSAFPKAPAYVPFDYIREPVQRIEVYRKLAQATDKATLTALQDELRDRFGPTPEAVELLLAVTELKLLAADKAVTLIETKDDKLMLTRHNDLLMVGGKFPRLLKKQPKARLNEIKKLLLAM
ncbi:MAG: transcription-repair coupling factor [Verrucomicrobia bacterium]|nr:transcription-repair coupling factor [Verrucomicrobiota bacterium]